MLHARKNDPVVTFSGVILWSLLLYECFVETEVVSNTILPSTATSICSTIERICVCNPFVDLGESELSVLSSQDCHADELGVTMRWLRSIIV